MTKIPEVRICNPCHDGHHLECDATELKTCDCLVCAAERIGDQEVRDVIVGDRFRRWDHGKRL